MSRAKKKGTAFETACVRQLQASLPWLDVSRQALHGSTDLGDIRGLQAAGMSLAVECKDTKAMNIPAHVREAMSEAQNAQSDGWILIQHYPGANIKTPAGMGQQLVAMSMSTFLTLIKAAHEGEKQ